jgi:hypothetical protein
MDNPITRDNLLRTARDYELMAVEAEQLQKTIQKTSGAVI